jgi:sugar diacid utilization regulator
MQVSLNIILDRLRHYRYEVHIDMPTDIAFRRISLLPRDLRGRQPDCLYVCRMSEALRAAGQMPGFYCLCLRDRFPDERETEEILSGFVVINENIELETLFSEIQDTFVQTNEWYQNMQDAIIRHMSIQDIITMSESVIGNFISVSDSALTLVAYTKNTSTDDPTSLFLIENGYHSDEAIRKFKVNKRFEHWMSSDGIIISTDGKISKYVCISKVFAFNDTYFMHVVMTCNHREMTAGLIDLFSHMVTVLSHYIKRNWEEKKDYDHVYSSLVVDLLHGSISDREVANDRASYVGIRPGDKYIVMLLTGGGSGNAVFPGLTAHEISRALPQIRTVYYNCRLMLFLHHAELVRYLEEQDIFRKLNDYFRENDIYCGLSDIFDNLLSLPEAYRQAELALNETDSNYQNGNIFWESVPQWSNIAPFNSYFASCLLDKSAGIEKIWRTSQYGRMLLELYNSDIEKSINNLEVLYTYLVNERRATETAVALHMHRNNVIYRISRIEELLKVSLDDRLTRLNLLMSFLMLKHSGFIQGRSGAEHGRAQSGE